MSGGGSGRADGRLVRLCVTNVPWEYCKDEYKHEIVQFFRKVGRVLQVSAPIDRADGRPRGYVFVTLKVRDELPPTAWQCLKGEFIGTRPVNVEIASRGPRATEGAAS